MKDEIKEMMEQMESISITGKNKNGIKVDGYGLQQNELKILLDLITNLQQRCEYLERSNNRREDTILGLRQEIYEQEDYKSRCEKAIKCIKNKYYKEEYERKSTFANKLMNILKNGSEEE